MDKEVSSQVKMANGELVKAKGQGTFAVETNKGTKLIHNVLLVPNLQ